MYCLEVAHSMNFSAAAWFFDAPSSPRAQLHSQPDDLVLSTGAGAKPILPATGLPAASRVDAATVASYHMAAFCCCMMFRHWLKLSLPAPFSPDRKSTRLNSS